MLEKAFGTAFNAPEAMSQVIERMLAAGPGARGIVFGVRSSGVGHVFNVVNQKVCFVSLMDKRDMRQYWMATLTSDF